MYWLSRNSLTLVWEEMSPHFGEQPQQRILRTTSESSGDYLARAVSSDSTAHVNKKSKFFRWEGDGLLFVAIEGP